MGGVIAFEMARQMQEQGQDVELLALVDAYAPLNPQPEITTTKAITANDLAGFALHLGFTYDQILSADRAILTLP